jgi:hypothetical protein
MQTRESFDPGAVLVSGVAAFAATQSSQGVSLDLHLITKTGMVSTVAEHRPSHEQRELQKTSIRKSGRPAASVTDRHHVNHIGDVGRRKQNRL